MKSQPSLGNGLRCTSSDGRNVVVAVLTTIMKKIINILEVVTSLLGE